MISPVTERIAEIKKRFKAVEYHDMWLDAERTKIITESYRKYEADYPLMKRAKFFRDLCEQMTVRVEDTELIVANQGRTYRAITPYVEWFAGVLFDTMNADDETFRITYQTDGCRNMCTDEDRQIFREAAEFWKGRSSAEKISACVPDECWDLHKSGALDYGLNRGGGNLIGVRCQGHFCANYNKVVHVGMKAIKEEAEQKMKEMAGHMQGMDGEKYIFYKSVSIVCEGMITLAKRYGEECARMAKEDRFDAKRKAELEQMADMFGHIIEYPCRNFWEAMQAINFYMLCLCLDGQNHGVTFGRIDQYAGHFLEADLASGAITEEFAQEIVDSFILKAAEYTRGEACMPPDVIEMPDGTVKYEHHDMTVESGQHFSVGGVDKDGNDASNALSYMLIQTYARLYLYSPSLSLRIHQGTPDDLWSLAIASSSRAGGMPTFENDDIIIPVLLKKGYTLEDARDYCLIGCVEPSGTGNEWPCCGASGAESFWNYGQAVAISLNNGINPLNGYQGGPATGYLYEFENMEQVKEAVKKTAEFYLNWHVSLANIAEIAYRQTIPCPLASATTDGCMESGYDVTWGGAKYNSTGVTCCGIGNVADSLAAIEWCCFDKKICTTRELYDALQANWEGYEELQQYITNNCPHYGNDDDYVDKYATWGMQVFCDIINNAKGPRGGWRPGTFTMTMNVVYGSKTAATPDGRYTGEPLAEAISPKQGLDKNGPTAYIKSAAKLPQIDIGNGAQLNIKFSPTVMKSEEGEAKIKDLIRTYFLLGGMQVQFNVVSADTLHDAQDNPDEYKDLIVRIAGFSAAFVELGKKVQDDFIRRTEHMV